MTAFLIVTALILIFLGLAGTIFPALPGLPLMFGGAWLLAYSGNYAVIGTGTLIVLFVFTAIGCLMDFVAGMMGARYAGAGRYAVWGSFAGSLAGMFFGIPGILFGAPAGAAVGEFWEKRALLSAGLAGIWTFVGFIIGTAAKIGCALAIVAVLAVRYLLQLF